MADPGDNDGLPEPNAGPNDVIMLKGATYNAIIRAIRRNRLKLQDTTGPLKLSESPSGGQVISLETDTCSS